MNFGIDDVLKADKLMIAEPKRPYYDSAAAAQRRAERIAVERTKWARAFGFGTAIVRRPSDETMKRLEHDKSAQRI